MFRQCVLVAILMAGGLQLPVEGAPAAKPQPGRGKAIDLIAEGRALEQNGDRVAAFQRYLESVQTAPSPIGYYNLGRLSRMSGDKEAARRYLDEALRLNPNYELAKMELLQVERGASSRAETVSAGVVPGTIETAVTADTPMNVDVLRREYTTLQSLKKPTNLSDPQIIAQGSLPGSQPQPSIPASTAPAPGYAEGAVIPPQPTYIENETNPRIIDNGLGRRPGLDVIEEGPVEARGSIPVVEEDLEEVSVEEAVVTETRDIAQVATTVEERTRGTQLEKVSREEINDAAFGPESQQDPGSIGYHQGRKVALGTFPFHRAKGDSYRAAQRWKEAAIEYQTALKLNPRDVETRALLAEVAGRHGSPTFAHEEFARAKAIDPSDSVIYYKEGNTFYDQQKYDQAIGSYRRAIELDPTNKFAHNNLGVVYMEKKDYSRAIASFKRVLELDPNYDMAILNLGIIYDEGMADPEEARKYYQRYIDLNGPRTTEVQRWLDDLPQ